MAQKETDKKEVKVKTEPISMQIPIEDIKYLKSVGINRSEFMRQSIQAHRDKKFKYNYDY